MMAVVPASEGFRAIRSLVLNAVSSPITRALYNKALEDFFAWWEEQGRPPFTRATVQAHRAFLEGQRYSASTINQHLGGHSEAGTRGRGGNGLLAPEPGGRHHAGTRRQTSGEPGGKLVDAGTGPKLINLPDPRTLKGKRDRAVLALLIGCALRRAEAASLTTDDLQQRDGRWVLPDLHGKHGRVRTVPVPSWVKLAIDQWTQAAGIAGGRLPRSMNRHGTITGASLSPQAIFMLVAAYGKKMGVRLQAHDARRTCAKLCRAAGGDLEQIQLLLGHASIQTTERYLVTRQNLVDAVNDRLGLMAEENPAEV